MMFLEATTSQGRKACKADWGAGCRTGPRAARRRAAARLPGTGRARGQGVRTAGVPVPPPGASPPSWHWTCCCSWSPGSGPVRQAHAAFSVYGGLQGAAKWQNQVSDSSVIPGKASVDHFSEHFHTFSYSPSLSPFSGWL